MNDLVAKALAMWSPVALYCGGASARAHRAIGWHADLSCCVHWSRTPGRRFAMPGDHAKAGTCRWCRTTSLPVGRRNWCSDRCVESFLSTKGHAHLTNLVRHRDGDCCQICRFDGGLEHERAIAFGRIAEDQAAARRFGNGPPSECYELSSRGVYRQQFKIALGRALGFSAFARAWFDVDHVVPKSLGGRNELPNLRLLCIRCHKAETAKLRIVLAAIRRFGFVFATDLDERQRRRRKQK